jgi:hypothetical protein
MRPDLLAHQPVDRRPDRFLRQRAELLDRVDDAQIEVLAQTGVDDRHGPRLDLAVLDCLPAQVARHLLQGPLRRGKPDPHKAAVALDRLQPFEQQRQKHAALVGAERVNLIDNDVGDAAQGVPAARGEEQVKRFGRGDQNVRRLAQQALTLGRGGVAGANGGFEARQRSAHLPGGLGDSFERGLEIAMDVVVERLQRRDVEDAHSARQRPLTPQVIEAGEEGRQRLARAGRRQDQRMPSGGDGRPSLALRRSRFAQGRAEPVAHGGEEEAQRIGVAHDGHCTRGTGVHASPSSESSSQQPRAWGASRRPWSRMVSSRQPASSRASARMGSSLKRRSS